MIIAGDNGLFYTLSMSVAKSGKLLLDGRLASQRQVEHAPG